MLKRRSKDLHVSLVFTSPSRDVLVHFYSPSLATMDVPLPQERLHRGDLDPAEVEKTMKAVPQGERALFIFDDCVASMPPGGKAIRPFIKMCYNRRHLTGKNAGIAIMIVSQKLAGGIPRQLRAAADGIFYWRTANRKEIRTFFDEYVSMDEEDFHRMLEFAWSDRYSFLFARLDRPPESRYHRNFELIKSM